jgi:hypothetical protein
MATARDPARRSLILGVLALALWPLSYAWVPWAGRNPDWILIVVPLAELGALACGVAALVTGLRARRSGARVILPHYLTNHPDTGEASPWIGPWKS